MRRASVLPSATGGCAIKRVSSSELEILTQPVIVSATPEVQALQDTWAEPRFRQAFGHYWQVLKDELVRPAGKDTIEVLNTSAYFDRMRTDGRNLLMFTNEIENPAFMNAIAPSYAAALPSTLDRIDGFRVFSAGNVGSSHSMHAHGASWLLQVHGRKVWYFRPPDAKRGPRINACLYHVNQPSHLHGHSSPHVSCVQQPGELVAFPESWFHATCTLDSWSVAIGAQEGHPTVPAAPLRRALERADTARRRTREGGLGRVGGKLGGGRGFSSSLTQKRWPHLTWYGHNVSGFYDSVEQHTRRSAANVESLAAHRWLGRNRSTALHYALLREAIRTRVGAGTPLAFLRVMDAGCGAGGALVWWSQHEPSWRLTGYTLSAEQHAFIATRLAPLHRFEVRLGSYDEPEGTYDAIVAIEALIHSPSPIQTIGVWASHLNPGGVIALIDDFLTESAASVDPSDVEVFRVGWAMHEVLTLPQLMAAAWASGLEVVEDRDVGAEFEVVQQNYGGQDAEMPDGKVGGRSQGWLGSVARRRLTVRGLLTYRLLVLRMLRKPGASSHASDHPSSSTPPITTIGPSLERRTSGHITTTLDGEPTGHHSSASSSASGGAPARPTPRAATVAWSCAAVRTRRSRLGLEAGARTRSNHIRAQLKEGLGTSGGKWLGCISQWYCCGKGPAHWDQIERRRTHNTSAFMRLPRALFGNYLEVFARRLSEFYGGLRPGAAGVFLDIGGTGSSVSGMKSVATKFRHFAGPLEYKVLDVDPAARLVRNAIVCDIEACPAASDCSADVTFSHTVLEHVPRPWLAFDTIARVTKRGGLTMHVVPWSWPYHATPADHFRFSHEALRTLLTDRGFEVLDIGYDVCYKHPSKVHSVTEHYEVVYLTYVVARREL